MRQGSFDGWSAAQVSAAFRAQHAVVGSRFEVFDIDGNHRFTLPTVHGEPGAAMVECGTNAELGGSLRLTLDPFEPLRRSPFVLVIHPYYTIRMDSHGATADVKMGEYVWAPFTRTLAEGGEIWSASLGNWCWWLDLGGPGTALFAVEQGERYTDAINRVFALAGLPRMRVPDRPEVAGKYLYWGLTKPRDVQRYEDELVKKQEKADAEITGTTRKQRQRQRKKRQKARQRVVWLKNWLDQREVRLAAVTWLKIVNDLCDAAGFQRLWFDWDGQPRVDGVKDVTAAHADTVYVAGPESMFVYPVQVTADITRLRNRVILRPTGQDAAKMALAVADADELYPLHPLARRNLHAGAYIDEVQDNSEASTNAALQALAVRMLRDALGLYEQVATSGLADPMHEPLDVAGLQFPGDADYNEQVLFLTKRLAFDLYDATATHQYERVFTYQSAPSPPPPSTGAPPSPTTPVALPPPPPTNNPYYDVLGEGWKITRQQAARWGW